MLERINNESFWLSSADCADVFIRRDAFEGLRSSSEGVGGDEVSEVRAKLRMAFMVETLDGCLMVRFILST